MHRDPPKPAKMVLIGSSPHQRLHTCRLGACSGLQAFHWRAEPQTDATIRSLLVSTMCSILEKGNDKSTSFHVSFLVKLIEKKKSRHSRRHNRQTGRNEKVPEDWKSKSVLIIPVTIGR